MANLTDILKKINLQHFSSRNETALLILNDKVKGISEQRIWRKSMESNKLKMFRTTVSVAQGIGNLMFPTELKTCFLLLI